MERGKKFEAKVGRLFEHLQAQYPKYVEVTPQFPSELRSGRRVLIDFRVTVDFPHEKQSYYFELQSRDKHSHDLADKIEAIRRDTPLSTFSFVHESPLSGKVAGELEARNVVAYDWKGLVRFTEGVELQLLQLVSADRTAKGLEPHEETSRSRLTELVEHLARTSAEKNTREVLPSKSSAEDGLVERIVEEVARDPGEALRIAKRFLDS